MVWRRLTAWPARPAPPKLTSTNADSVPMLIISRRDAMLARW
jgi:hypothetical protein